MSDIIERIEGSIKGAIERLYPEEKMDLHGFVEVPKDLSHGDFASNIALRLAKKFGLKPIELAKKIEGELLHDPIVEKIEIAEPGFINIFVKKESLSSIIHKILVDGEDFGRNCLKSEEKVMVEYVSANPTGDLHLGHARGAAYGDSLTRVLKYAGIDRLREYYVNDAGNQIEVLAESLYQRYREALKQDFDVSKIGYQGKDVVELAKKIASEVGGRYLDDDSETRIDFFKSIGTELELDKIKKDLSLYRVSFDHYQSELELYRSGKVKAVLEELKKSGHTYFKDGALWLKTTDYGDDKDRVLVKSDGSYTYLLPDIAYHKDKFDRGYERLIDVFGADHHGYIARLKAALSMLGYDSSKLEIEIIQIVRLMEDGVEVKMSKRTGNAVTIRELCEDVGVDVARYFFISKPIVSHLDFDLNLARKHSNENPIYYIQYAFARCSSILKKDHEYSNRDSYDLLINEKEASLLKQLSQFENALEETVKSREVNVLSNYLYKLAQFFHSYYNDSKVIDPDNSDLTSQRLALIKATSIVIKIGLNLLGIEVKESM
jgi:arginyl-tRNA synthetase